MNPLLLILTSGCLLTSCAAIHDYEPAYKKGQLQLRASAPHINNFYLHPRDESGKSNTGFFGISLGLNYYHSNNQFINLGASAVTDLMIPFPAPIDYSGEREFMSSMYIALSNNHHWKKRFTSGYGISVAKNIWDLEYFDRFDAPPPSRPPVKKQHYAVGFLFSTYYQLTQRFSLGVIYRPTLARKMAYEHLVSIDFGWNFVLKK